MVTGTKPKAGNKQYKESKHRPKGKGAAARAKHKEKGITLPAPTAAGGAKPSRVPLLHTWH